MIRKALYLFTALTLLVSCDSSYKTVAYRNWEGCVELSNDSVKVIINPTYGGQILHFGFLGGHNVLWADSVVNGWTLAQYKATRRSPDAGRFDVGYERKTEHMHDELWAGQYTILEGSRHTLRIISDTCSAMGVVVERHFQLDCRTTELIITQTMRNVSNHQVEYCFWTRTLLPANGIYTTNCTETDRYPKGFSDISLQTDSLLPTPTSETRITVNNGVFTAFPRGSERRYGINTRTGISEYLLNDVVYRKECDFSEGAKYENNAGEAFPNMIYFCDQFIELEPHSAMQNLKPNSSFKYTERWTLKNK